MLSNTCCFGFFFFLQSNINGYNCALTDLGPDGSSPQVLNSSTPASCSSPVSSLHYVEMNSLSATFHCGVSSCLFPIDEHFYYYFYDENFMSLYEK